jgi:OOP family OmpA-OmpF porin
MISKKFILGTFLLFSFLGISQEKVFDKFNRWSIEISAGFNKGVSPYAPSFYSADPTTFLNISNVNHYDFGGRYMLSNVFGLKFVLGYDQFSNQIGSGSLAFETEQYWKGF